MFQKGLAPILIILLLAAAIGGYFIYQKQTKPAFVQQITQPSPNPKDANPAPTGAGETANWKTYTNAKYGYTVKYPTNWGITDVYSDEMVTFGFKGDGNFGSYPPLVSIRVFETSKFKQEDIGSYTPFEYKIIEENGYTFFIYAGTYQIGASESEETRVEAKRILKQILPTFKFLDQK